MIHALLVLLYVAIDFAWAQYMIEVARKRAMRAGLWAVGLYLLGAVGLTAWLHDRRYMVSICVGSFIGTFLATKRSAR